MASDEFGDFQTSEALAAKVVALLAHISSPPANVIEPTCGRGNFVAAALEAFDCSIVHGLEIQRSYVMQLESRFQFCGRFVLHHDNYFDFDWSGLIDTLRKPVWVVGNPPWVTNTHLAKIDSSNLPAKTPQAGLTGFAAQTGKSNFDISESMIRDWLNWCFACSGSMAVICKTSVARKILLWWWKTGSPAPTARIYEIDAKAEFNVTVSACVLMCSFETTSKTCCAVYDHLDATTPSREIAFIDNILVSDAASFLAGKDFKAVTDRRWRSGIKHDAASVLELYNVDGSWINKNGAKADIEGDLVFPLLKGSEISMDFGRGIRRSIIVPHRHIGENALGALSNFPKTLGYLQRYNSVFDARKSVIYKKGGPFSVFGIGPYSFLPWKIAVAALYKRLSFYLIGPIAGKPVMFDDTVYFLAFESEFEARRVLAWLKSKEIDLYIRSMIFWDDMRPIKTEMLNRLSLAAA